MSVNVDSAPVSVQQQTAAATRRVHEALQLGALKVGQIPKLTLALVEVAAQEITRDGDFAERVRKAFVESISSASPQPGSRQGRRSTKKDDGGPIKAIRQVDPSRFAIYGPSDPYALLEQYGAAQLPKVLGKFLMADLMKSAAVVQARNQGANLKSKPKKTDVIEFIVQHVTGDQ